MSQIAQAIAARLVAEWRLKIGAALALSTGFFGPYFILQHKHLFTPWIVPAIRIDRWIPFQPGWMAIYLSLWTYMSAAAWLTIDRARLLHYVRGIVLLSIIGIISFSLFPTAIQRPPLTEATDRLYQWIVSFDGTANALPSMHAALAVFAALFTRRAIVIESLPRWLMLLNGAWCMAILYATLATKQHMAIDIIAGSALGGLIWITGAGGRA